MPNHCSNNLTVIGPDTTAFFEAVATGPNENFIDALIPMPLDLSTLSTSSAMIDGEKVEIWREVGDGKREKIPALELQHLENLYGTTDWYNWARRNWGTKWGAYDVDVRADEGFIKFDSAWSPPLTAVETIAAMFPRNTFQLSYAEGGSSYYGQGTFSGGAIIDQWDCDEFWKPEGEVSEDADYFESLTEECAEFLEQHGLHVGG